MSKRSREASFSPPAGLPSSSVSDTDHEDHSPDELETEHPVKISALMEEEQSSLTSPVMQCSLPPHRHSLVFPNVEAFEVHYNQEHCNRCSSCSKNFPSPHFLALHIDENHNPMREALQAKGEKTYGCFVEDCEKKCSTPQKRRLHLVDKHGFPKFYDFRVIDRGIDGSRSMLREPKGHRRRVSTASSPADSALRRRRASSQQTNGDGPQTTPATSATSKTLKPIAAKVKEPPAGVDRQIDELEASMSALQFVPPSVSRHQVKRPSK